MFSNTANVGVIFADAPRAEHTLLGELLGLGHLDISLVYFGPDEVLQLWSELLHEEKQSGLQFGEHSSVAFTYSEANWGWRAIEGMFNAGERNTLISYLRLKSPRPVNQPANGSTYTFCGSLPEQWRIVSSIDDVFVPNCRWTHVGSEGSDQLFQYYFPPRVSDWFDVPALGQRCVYAFFDGKDCICLSGTSGWTKIETDNETTKSLRKIRDKLRENYQVQLGIIRFFFNGKILFWSVSPFIHDTHKWLVL